MILGFLYHKYRYDYEKGFNVYGNYDCSFLYGGLQ